MFSSFVSTENIPYATKFELPRHIVNMLKDIPFFGKDHEDAYKHIHEVVEIANYFKALNVSKDAVMLRLLPLTLKDTTKYWLKSLPFGTITTWADFRTEFVQQFTSSSKISKLKKNIKTSNNWMGVVVQSL